MCSSAVFAASVNVTALLVRNRFEMAFYVSQKPTSESLSEFQVSDKPVYQACGMAGEFLGKAQHGQNRKRAESCMLRGGLTEVTAPKPVGFPVSEARLVGVGSIRPVDATNPRTLSVEFTVSYCV